MFIFMYLYVYIYVDVCGYKNICMYVCMFRCGYVGITVCVCVCVCVRVRARAQGAEKTVNPLNRKYIYWGVEIVNRRGRQRLRES